MQFFFRENSWHLPPPCVRVLQYSEQVWWRFWIFQVWPYNYGLLELLCGGFLFRSSIMSPRTASSRDIWRDISIFVNCVFMCIFVGHICLPTRLPSARVSIFKTLDTWTSYQSRVDAARLSNLRQIHHLRASRLSRLTTGLVDGLNDLDMALDFTLERFRNIPWKKSNWSGHKTQNLMTKHST